MEHHTKISPKTIVCLVSPTLLLSEYVAKEARLQQFAVLNYETFEGFFSVYDGKLPGCIVLYSNCYGSELAVLLRRIRSVNKHAQVILSVSDWHVHDIVNAIQEGFADFLDVTIDSNRLGTILSNTIQRDRFLREEGRVEIPHSLLHALNSEEVKILRLFVMGKTTKQISAELDLSVRTVHYRKTSIFEKIGVRDRNEAFEIVRAIRHDTESRIPQPHVANACRNVSVQDAECSSESR